MADLNDFATAVGALFRPIRYDSGPRDLSSLTLNGWTGPVSMLRTGRDVTYFFDGVTAGTSNSGAVSIPAMAAPRPLGGGQMRARGELHTASGQIRRTACTATAMYVYGSTPGEALYGTVSWSTTAPTPAPGTEPGSPI